MLHPPSTRRMAAMVCPGLLPHQAIVTACLRDPPPYAVSPFPLFPIPLLLASSLPAPSPVYLPHPPLPQPLFPLAPTPFGLQKTLRDRQAQRIIHECVGLCMALLVKQPELQLPTYTRHDALVVPQREQWGGGQGRAAGGRSGESSGGAVRNWL